MWSHIQYDPRYPNDYATLFIMDQLVSEIRQIISQSRESAARSINHALALMYWHIGRLIVEDEQHGQERATYGKALIKNLSTQLVADYGENFSSRNLHLGRVDN
ncbi:hypothetical protein BH09BAC4_BH09BAC4_23320 [soil metagenome]